MEKLGKDLGTVTVDGVEYKRYRKYIRNKFIQFSILIKINGFAQRKKIVHWEI